MNIVITSPGTRERSIPRHTRNVATRGNAVQAVSGAFTVRCRAVRRIQHRSNSSVQWRYSSVVMMVRSHVVHQMTAWELTTAGAASSRPCTAKTCGLWGQVTGGCHNSLERIAKIEVSDTTMPILYLRELSASGSAKERDVGHACSHGPVRRCSFLMP